MSTTGADRAARTPRSASIAAGLSFLWPGLGQWYAGRSRAAALYALPVVLLAAVVIIRVSTGLNAFAAQLIDPSVAATILVLIIVLGVWRLLSIIDAGAIVDRRRFFRGRAGAILGVLVALVVAMHAVGAYYAWSFYDAGSRIFVPETRGPSPTPSDSALPTEDLPATPFATPETASSRITILMTGIDKNTERTHSLTDTMLVLSVDPVTGKSAMLSFPRDISNFPLYTGGTYAGKLNSLSEYANSHPDVFPDGGLPTLAKELGFLLGIPIHYYAAVDLDGFQRMIDEVGGVTVTLDKALIDVHYNWLDGHFGLYIPKGKQTLDGRTALAYVRSRYGVGDNDFTRAARQQVLLLALRAKLSDPAMLPKLPAILKVAGDTIRTNFPPDRIGEMVDLAARISDQDVTRTVLQPPIYSVHPPTNTTGGIYTLNIHWDAIRALSVQLFGTDSAFWTGQVDASGSPVPVTAPPSN